MAQRPWAGCVAGAALVVGCAAVVRAQSSAADAWSRVPALPTGCYTDAADADPFDKANAALTTEYDRQKKLNDQLKAQFDKMDQAEKMQRMQAFMMRDPQKAMAVMQAIQASAVSAGSQAMTSSTEGPKLDQELDAIHAKYKTEVNTLLKPIDDKAAAFANTHSQRGEAGYVFTNKADEAQYNAIMQERNTAYERMCANWWGSSGAINGWFGRYKAFLTKEAKAYETADDAWVVQMQVMESPTGGYRSVYSMEAAQKFMAKARTLFYDGRPGKDLTTGWLR